MSQQLESLAASIASTERMAPSQENSHAPNASPSLAPQPERRSALWRFLVWLKPLSNGPGEIRALDGVRAIAALMIVVFHLLLLLQFEYQPFSKAIDEAWYYLGTGVQLFFVLSGFLLFLPYARAMLTGRPLPSARRFYQRRALRILPAYWVCLAFMIWLSRGDIHTFLPWNIPSHILLIHDYFPRYNRGLDGPFWTLAVESQFYVLLPLLAWGLARLVRASRSLLRLIGGLLVIILCAMALHAAALYVMGTLPINGLVADKTWGKLFVILVMGSQGKFIEVFAVGMICSALYVATVEGGLLTPRVTRALAWPLLVVMGGVVWFGSLHTVFADVLYTPGKQWGWQAVGYPLLVGVGYGALVLAVVWGGPIIRYPFSVYPLRFIGLISFSLYLWHLPILHGLPPYLVTTPVWLRLVIILLVSYLSYQFVERPFLRWRINRKPAPTANVAASADAAGAAGDTAAAGAQAGAVAGAPTASVGAQSAVAYPAQVAQPPQAPDLRPGERDQPHHSNHADATGDDGDHRAEERRHQARLKAPQLVGGADEHAVDG